MTSSIKRTAPPIIILLDVLFIFMFSVLLETSHGIAIEIVNGMPQNGVLIVKEDDSQILVFDNNMWKPLHAVSASTAISYYKIFPCDDSCWLYQPELPREEIGILVYDVLYDEIARINFLACSLGNSSCNSMKIFLSPKGINKEYTLQQNSSLGNIPGVADYM